MLNNISKFVSQSAIAGVLFGSLAATSGQINGMIADVLPTEANQAMSSYYQQNPNSQMIPGIQALGSFHVVTDRLSKITGVAPTHTTPNVKFQLPAGSPQPLLQNVSYNDTYATQNLASKKHATASAHQKEKRISSKSTKRSHHSTRSSTWRHPDEIQFYRP